MHKSTFKLSPSGERNNCETQLAHLLKIMQATPANSLPTCCSKRRERSLVRLQQQQQQLQHYPVSLNNNNNSQTTKNSRSSAISVMKAPDQAVPKQAALAGDNNAAVVPPLGLKTAATKNVAKQQQKPTSDRREPWSERLASKKSSRETVQSTFSNFDPLRTLHFLVKELHFKVKDRLPEDNGVQQMLHDIQSALRRVPSEVASIIDLQQQHQLPSGDFGSGHLPGSTTTTTLKDGKYAKVILSSSSHEDNNNNEELYKIIEENKMKLETACKQFEMHCETLKNDNARLESELNSERESAKFYKSRATDLDNEIKQLINVRLKKLEDEINQLQSQIVKSKSESQSGYADLKLLVKELKIQKTSAQQECTKLKNQIAILVLEKEKYATMVSVRDREINLIQNEVTKIQNDVGNQLIKLHSDMIPKLPDKIELNDLTISSIATDSSFNKKLSFRELPSGATDGSILMQQHNKTTSNDVVKELKAPTTSHMKFRKELNELTIQANAVPVLQSSSSDY